MTKRVSIIIPTLNEEKYIGKLLNCLVRQTYKDFEVVVVDGNSEDRTKEVIKKYKNKLDLKLINSKKKNIALQRNLGAEKARHSAIIFIDADVIIEMNFLQKSIAQIRNRKAKAAIPKYIPLDKKWYYKLFFSIINFTLWLTQKVKPCGIGICIFSNKITHNKVKGFNENLFWTDDMEYIYKLSKKIKITRLSTNAYLSVRRFEKEGTKKTMKKWIKSYFYFLSGRMDKTNLIEYLK